MYTRGASLLSDEKHHRCLTLVFDIDDVLAGHQPIIDSERLYYMRKSGIIIAAEQEHQVFVGVVELLKFVFSKPYIRVAFFSSGAKVRNDMFVEKLLTLALGEEVYREVRHSVRVLSKEDCTEENRESSSRMLRRYGIDSGNLNKDIRKALEPDASLQHAILIDDDRTFTYEGQEKNILVSPWGRSDSLNYLKKLVINNGEFLEDELKERFSRHNSAFFVAGMLDECIKIHEAGGELTQFLFDAHYKKSTRDLFAYQPKYQSELNVNYYEQGLACLRNINPQLEFVTAYDYINTIQAPVNDMEQSLLDECKQAKTSDCCIM